MTAARKRTRTSRQTSTRGATRDGGTPIFKRPGLLIGLLVVFVVAVIAFFPIALATDNSAFCKSCHTMVPFYDAWTQGQHADHAQCIDCHVDAGYPARFAHKFVALQEVYAQFFTKATFPNYNADIPNARCLRCHPDAPTKVVGQFKHADHVSKGVTCAKCHSQTGHRVSFASLGAAGVLNTKNALAGQQYVAEKIATGGTGKDSVYPGHRPVPCQGCHDQANLQCSYCHTPPGKHYGDNCRLCHKNAAVPFKQFVHPKTHHKISSRPCVKCHPNGYDTVYCTCHKGNPPKGD